MVTSKYIQYSLRNTFSLNLTHCYMFGDGVYETLKDLVFARLQEATD